MRTKRVPVSQAMIASIIEKRKRPEGKVTEEPPVISCTAKELDHILDKWIGDEIVRLFTISRPPTKEERKRITCFVGFITMSNTLLRITRPFEGFFIKILGRRP